MRFHPPKPRHSSMWSGMFMGGTRSREVEQEETERIEREEEKPTRGEGQRSVRSAMSIARTPRENQAPLGAACSGCAGTRVHMPLPTELEEVVAGSGFYPHGAPNGAISACISASPWVGELYEPGTTGNRREWDAVAMARDLVPCAPVRVGGVATLLFVLLTALRLSAAGLYWDGDGSGAVGGGAGTWNTTLNRWSTNSTGSTYRSWGNGNNDDANFGGTAGTVTISPFISAQSLTFSVGGYTVTNATGSEQLNLASTGAGTFSTLAGNTTISCVLTGAVSMVKIGAATLSLVSAANDRSEERRVGKEC